MSARTIPGRPARDQDLQERVDRALRPKSAECGDVNWAGIGRRGAAIARRTTVSQTSVTARAAPTPAGGMSSIQRIAPLPCYSVTGRS